MTGSRFRPILLLLSGNLIGAAVGGTFFFLASWRLSIEDMGRYAVAISVHWIAFGLFGTGLALATLRIARDRLAAGDRPGAAGVVLTAGLSGLLLTMAGAGVVYWIFRGLGIRVSLAHGIVFLTVSWAASRVLLECLRSGLLAEEDYNRVALLSVTSAATGLTAIAVAFVSGELTVARLLGAHVLGMLSGALAGFLLLRRLAREGLRPGGERALFMYARWPALSEGTRLLHVNLGAPLLAAIAGSGEAGLFALGRYPAYVFDVIAVTFYQYWLARAVQVPDAARMREHLTPQFRLAVVLGAIMIGGALVVQPLFPLLGSGFARAAPLMILSAVDFAISLVSRSIESVFHGLARPRLELVQRCVTFAVLAAVVFPLVTRWGAMGMMGAHVISSMVSLGTALVLVRRALAITPAIA